MEFQKTLRKVAIVKAKDTKPMIVEAKEIGASVECETVMPIGIVWLKLVWLRVTMDAVVW